jgi:hypothetical protein
VHTYPREHLQSRGFNRLDSHHEVCFQVPSLLLLVDCSASHHHPHATERNNGAYALAYFKLPTSTSRAPTPC